MKHIKKFNETKKEDKIEDQEVLFNAEVLVDKDEKPSFNTSEEEDQEKIKKEFDKLRKVKKFENFILIRINEVINDKSINEIEQKDRHIILHLAFLTYRSFDSNGLLIKGSWPKNLKKIG